ncbi:MFS transporter [Eggerthella sp. YY7918]|uniref:MFS transporter n=1 Tax=Eggerthella sp. (strain YY7918) TaxID=502558 RepID=UPI00021717D6|nr:MFS transporter [Eggerthella sp. YY7918]BAK45628.1 hypothetical protein EGYY_26270 [Eggerthella sp. YY7918]
MAAPSQEKLWTKSFILGTGVNFLLMVNYFSLMVVVADYAMKTYGAPASTAGLAASIFIIGALVARLMSGRIMDHIGRKRLLVVGAVLDVAFSALYLTGITFEALFVVRFLHGFAYGACSTTIGTIVTSLVPNGRKGEGIGYYMLSSTLSAAIGPFIGMILTSMVGFKVLFIVATTVAALSLLAATLLKAPEAPRVPRPQTKQHRIERPHLSNYLERSIIPIGSVCALLFFCYSSLLAFLTPFAAEQGLETAGSFFFVVYAIAMFVTRPFTGKLFDRRGDRIVMIPAFISFIAGMALLATVHQAFPLLVAAAFLGFGVGTVQSSGLALAVRITPDSRLGLANSTFYVLMDVGVGIGPLILGLAQPFWGYAGLFATMAGAAFVALMAYLLVSRPNGPMRRKLETQEKAQLE